MTTENARGSGLLFATTLVGSYPQPDWLIDRERLRVPRVRVPELWRIGDDYLSAAQEDAIVLAVLAQERAGIDIVTDGEIRRESYSNHFGTRLGGIDLERPGIVRGRGPDSPQQIPVPRVVGPIVRPRPVHVEEVRFLRAMTSRKIKVTLPGPFTLSQQSENAYYEDDAAMAMAYADVVRAEMDDLFKAGADVVQLDEPWMEARPEKARDYGKAALAAALRGAAGVTAVHICFGYGALVPGRPPAYAFLPDLADIAADQVSIETAQSNLDCAVLEQLPEKTIILGVIDLSTADIETPELVVERVERALRHVSPDRLVLAPDCGMKFLPRAAADGKLHAMVEAAKTLRARYATLEVPATRPAADGRER